DYLLGALEVETLQDRSRFDTFAGERKLNSDFLRRYISDLERRRKQVDPIFKPWFELTKETNFNDTHLQAILSNDVNPVVVSALQEKKATSAKELAEAYNKIFKEIDGEWKTTLSNAPAAPQKSPLVLQDTQREALRQFLYADGTPLNPPRTEAETIL